MAMAMAMAIIIVVTKATTQQPTEAIPKLRNWIPLDFSTTKKKELAEQFSSGLRGGGGGSRSSSIWSLSGRGRKGSI